MYVSMRQVLTREAHKLEDVDLQNFSSRWLQIHPEIGVSALEEEEFACARTPAVKLL